MDKSFLELILSHENLSVLPDEPMGRHTTFGVGGPVSAFAVPEDLDSLKFLLEKTAERGISLFYAGSGSNLLVSDRGFDGVVVSLRGSFKNMRIDDDLTITAESGVMLGTLVKEAVLAGAAGFENLNGVPGTVGGALAMNAGAFGCEISRYLYSVNTLDKAGVEHRYLSNEVQFSYRSTTIPADEIIVAAVFKCPADDPSRLKQSSRTTSRKRRESQPLNMRSAGSVFKNPDVHLAAGFLIEKAGLKGLKVGGAEVSRKHANFIVNTGSATASDIMALINRVRNEIARQFHVNLELEVKLLGFD